MIKQSGNLTAYYLAILNWIETGESVFPFSHSVALCGNAFAFCDDSINANAARMLIEEMQMQFVAAGLNDLLPFNDTSAGDTPFRNEIFKYRNPKRLQWIKDRAII